MFWEGDIAAGDSGSFVRGNTVQKRDATLPGEDLDPGLGKDRHRGGPGRT